MAVHLLSSELDQLIRQAIAKRRLLQLHYQERLRIVEPHDYGIAKGAARLFAFQVGGASSSPLPNWRMLFVEKISNAKLLDLTFPGGRAVPSGVHQEWDVLFARVVSAQSASS